MEKVHMLMIQSILFYRQIVLALSSWCIQLRKGLRAIVSTNPLSNDLL